MTTAHEPRRGPGTHLSVEDLSALAEGSQPAAAGAAAHLLECEACRGEVDALSELLAQFEEWDTPAIPQEVAIRIDAALARESAARAENAGSGNAASADSRSASAAPARAKSSDSSRRRRWVPARGLAWGLAVLVVVAGGVGLAVKLGSSGTQAASAASGSSNATRPYAVPGSQGALGPMNSSAEPPMLRAPGSQLAVWTRQALSKQALAKREPTAQAASSCAANPAFVGRQELATTNGTYDGVAATLVVYAVSGNPSTAFAVVYASPCAPSTYRVLDEGLVAK